MHLRFVFATALALLAPLPAWAEPSAAELDTARQLFQEATELEERAAWAEARAKLEEAAAIKDTPGLRFHLGYCSEQLGQNAAALVEYERAYALIQGGQSAPDVERTLLPALERVRTRVARLTLRFPENPSSLRVTVDGRELTATEIGHAVPLAPGEHKVEIGAPDHEAQAFDLRLAAGEERLVDILLTRKKPAPRAAARAPSTAKAPLVSAPLPAAEAERARSGLGTREVVLIGEATVALVGAGVGLGFLMVRNDAGDRAKAAQKEVDASSGGRNDSACSVSSPAAACSRLFDAIDEHDRAGVLATVGFVAGGVGAAAAVVTLLAWPSERGHALGIAPAVAGTGLSAFGRF